jgi:hypothetical protein
VTNVVLHVHLLHVAVAGSMAPAGDGLPAIAAGVPNPAPQAPPGLSGPHRAATPVPRTCCSRWCPPPCTSARAGTTPLPARRRSSRPHSPRRAWRGPPEAAPAAGMAIPARTTETAASTPAPSLWLARTGRLLPMVIDLPPSRLARVWPRRAPAGLLPERVRWRLSGALRGGAGAAGTVRRAPSPIAEVPVTGRKGRARTHLTRILDGGPAPGSRLKPDPRMELLP